LEKDTIINGQPGFVLLPSKNYSFKKLVSPCVIDISLSGKFSELYPDFFELTDKDESNDDIEIIIQNNAYSHIMSVKIIELLFAAKKYPALEYNQIFSIASITIDNERDVLSIVGDLLEIIE